MAEETINPESENSSQKNIGVGTPLKDTVEANTPLYTTKEKHNPVIGIGPGTPLADFESEPEFLKPQTVTVAPVKVPDIIPSVTPPVLAPAPAPAVAPVAVSAESLETMEDGDENFAIELKNLLDADPNPGEVVKGRIIRIDDDGVVVDIGSKSEGIIDRKEFINAKGEFMAREGEEVEVLLERRENREGLLVLSKEKVDSRKGWNAAKAALANNGSLEGQIFQICKGGFMVDLGGVKAFLPSSQLDLHPVNHPEVLMNKACFFKVIKLNKERGNIVVSRRNHLMEEKDKKRSDVISKLTPGRIVHGVVKNLTNFGAFVDIGGMDALLHVNDMSWSKISHPKQLVNIGDEIEALVLAIDNETGKVALGLKQKSQDPWVNIAEKYPLGSLVEGQVVSLVDFGAFLKIEEGVEGLLPISELSWTTRVRHPKDVLKTGDSVRVLVMAIDASAKKITLSLRQTEKEPFALFCESHKIGDVISGEVKNLSAFGAFVEVADGVTGLAHISDLGWNGSVKNPQDVVKSGDKIKVKILEIQKDKKKISLGMKQLTEDPWNEVVKKYSVGTLLQVKVVRNTKFGVFVELEPGIEGLIHVTQLEREKGKADFTPLPEGQMIDAKIIKVNSEEHKIGLSIREAVAAQEAVEMKKYLAPANKPGFSLGEASGVNMEELLKRVSQRDENS